MTGDVNETLKQIQAETRDELIDDLYRAARRIYLHAARLVGVSTDLSRAIASLEIYDRSALYPAYEKISTYYRIVHDDGGQTDFIRWTNSTELELASQADDYPQKIANRWHSFFEQEIDRLLEDSDFVRLVLQAIAPTDTAEWHTTQHSLQGFFEQVYGNLLKRAQERIEREGIEEHAAPLVTVTTASANANTGSVVAAAAEQPAVPVPLAIQPIELAEVAELGHLVTDMVEAENLPVYAAGHCYAFYLEPLSVAASARGISWHIDLLQRAIVGLHAQKSQQHVLVGYQVTSQMVRVFVFARWPHSWQRFSKVIGSPGFIEEGDDSVRIDTFRALAYWEPTNTAVALWPTGLEGETTGTRVVDTGNLRAYFSEEVDEDLLATLDPADYVPVPGESAGTFVWNKKQISYANRFVVLHM